MLGKGKRPNEYVYSGFSNSGLVLGRGDEELETEVQVI